MSVEKKFLFIIAALLAAAIAGGFFYFVADRAGDKTSPHPTPKSMPHYYQESNVSLQKIRLKVFYVVPANKTAVPAEALQAVLRPVLKQMAAFHHLQFRGLSDLRYEIYPTAVILEQDNLAYDTENTNHGNPQALLQITREITKRYPDFLKSDPEEFVVIGLIYEGTGASGTRGATLLSRTFLIEREYEGARASLLYHEFGHALGLPDNYDFASNQPLSLGIMGGGRFGSLEGNYLDPELLPGVGLIKDN